MAKAWLIDPLTRSVTPFQVRDYREIQSGIGAFFCIMGQFPDGDVGYCDDEGMLKAPTLGFTSWAGRDGRSRLIAGRIVVTGPDRHLTEAQERESRKSRQVDTVHDVRISEADLRKHFTFLTNEEAKAHLDAYPLRTFLTTLDAATRQSTTEQVGPAINPFKDHPIEDEANGQV